MAKDPQILGLGGVLIDWRRYLYYALEMDDSEKTAKIVDDLVKGLSKIFKKLLLLANPLLWTLVSFCFTWLLCLVISSGITPPTIVGVLLLFAPVLALLGAITANVVFYPLNEKFLGRLIQVYFAVALLFANAYFLLVLAKDNGQIPFEGIAPAWTWLQWPAGRVLHLRNALIAYIDCVHFSCVTITTLGYGDMRPTEWYSKLLVDLEAFCGVGIIVIGIGRYFSRLGAGPSKS